eukprot:TRINITY_DN14589_c0_g1_i3.p2 TRINITY_DN14589_c0_g1~~TRINITY_DN14589_c0_g1_i3.p2  ORF type:complete len:209 (-),score=79.15 TRINITY_DN14589_c0_g1_i3:141-767(-)
MKGILLFLLLACVVYSKRTRQATIYQQIQALKELLMGEDELTADQLAPLVHEDDRAKLEASDEDFIYGDNEKVAAIAFAQQENKTEPEADVPKDKTEDDKEDKKETDVEKTEEPKKEYEKKTYELYNYDYDDYEEYVEVEDSDKKEESKGEEKKVTETDADKKEDDKADEKKDEEVNNATLAQSQAASSKPCCDYLAQEEDDTDEYYV